MPEGADSAGRLTEEVLADARRRVERRRRSAEREAQKIIEAARREAQREADRIVQEARQRAEREAQLIRATIDQEIHRRRVVRQAALLEELIQAGFERLLDRSPEALPRRRETLVGLTVEAILQMQGNNFRLQVAPEDRDLVDEGFLAEVTRRLEEAGFAGRSVVLDRDSPPIAGGVMVWSEDGRELVDNSLEARRRRLAPQLRRLLAEMVFPEGDRRRGPAEGKAEEETR